MTWETATADRLGSPHRHVVHAHLEDRTGATVALSPVQDGGLSVTLDETSAPYVQAHLTAAAIPEAVAAADPVAFTKLVITAGYAWPDGREDHGVLCSIPLVSRTTGRPANTMALDAASVETLAMHYHMQWHSGPIPNEYLDTLANMYGWLVSFPTNGSGVTVPRVWPSEWQTKSPGVGGYLADFAIGDNLWSQLDGLGSALGFKVYGDELGRWAGRYTGNTDGTVSRLRLAPGANLITSDATVGYGSYYNAVVDHYEWKDLQGNDQRVFGRARITSGPYSVTNSPERVQYLKRPGRTDQGAATAAASRRVRLLAARRDLITVEAVAWYDLRPKNRVTLRLPTWTADEQWIVQAVTFTPGTGRMKLTLRRPINATATVDTTGE